MSLNRHGEYVLDLSAVALMVPLLALPLFTANPIAFSLAHQIVIGTVAAWGVYIMLRLDLLAFTAPAFMAIGAYAAAMLAKSGVTTNLIVLMLIAFVVPALLAIPLGALVLRLRGVYFIFVTYLCSEILQVLIFETPSLTGGSNGVTALPPASMFGVEMASQTWLLVATVCVGIVAALVTLLVTHRFRAEFSSIEENELLTESLGVPIWKYRTLGFVVSAGVSGLAGFAMVNQLSTAHPSSFTSFSAITYIAYVFVGGRRSMLGAFVGAAVLIGMSNLFSAQSQRAGALFGLLLIAVVMIAPGGLVGAGLRLCKRVRPTLPASSPGRETQGESV